MSFSQRCLLAPLHLLTLAVVSFLPAPTALSSSTVPTAAPATPSSTTLAQTAQADYSTLEQDLLREIDRARTNPAAYANQLDALRQHYDGTVLSLPGEDPIQTHEGVAALDDALTFLRSQPPLLPIKRAAGMAQAARDHRRDLGDSGSQDKRGSDGSTAGDRLTRYGAWSGSATELLSYGKRTATAIVELLLINDGNPTRSLRAALFNPDYQFMGLACGWHATHQTLCVMNYAAQYTDHGQRSETTKAGALTLTAAKITSSQAVPTIAPASPAAPASTVLGTDASLSLATHQPVLPVAAPAPSTTREEPLDSDTLNGLSTLELDIVAETNRLRQDPVAYAAALERLRSYYEGKLLKLPGSPAFETEEGVAALEEAITALRRTPSLLPLMPSQGMSLGARDHVQDLGPAGRTGHIGSDGSTPFTRLNRYGTWQLVAGENISYSPLNRAQWHVMQLLIDDGVPGRGHRKALLNAAFKVTGVACGTHTVYENICVMTYAEKYLDQDRPMRLQNESSR